MMEGWSRKAVVRRTTGGKPRAVRRTLTDKELFELLMQAGLEGAEWSRLFALGLYTGLRLLDCGCLDWKDIDLERSLVRFRPSMQRQTVDIAFGRSLRDELMEVSPEDRHGLVLPAIGPMLKTNRTRVSATIRKIFTQAGLEYSERGSGFGFSTLRACYIAMVRFGYPEESRK